MEAAFGGQARPVYWEYWQEGQMGLEQRKGGVADCGWCRGTELYSIWKTQRECDLVCPQQFKPT